MFKTGDFVKIAPEWLNNQDEAELVYVVVNVNEATERCVIELVTTDLPLRPTELVAFAMIEKAYK